MELRHLKLVQAVAHSGSLTKAGAMLYLTQSALSHQLKELETQLGAPLFQRINRKMILTTVGQRVLESATRVLEELDRTKNDVKSLINGDSGLIRLSAGCYTCYHWLPQLMKSFEKIFPNVEIRVISEPDCTNREMLMKGSLDLGITSNKSDHTSLIYSKLFEDEMVVVCSRDHEWAEKKVVSASDFSEAHLFMYPSTIEESRLHQELFIPANVSPKKVTMLPLTEAKIEMAKAGLGVSVLAEWAIKPYLRGSNLITIPLRKKLKRKWYAVTVKQENPMPYLNSFIEHLSCHLPSTCGEIGN